MNEAPLAFPSKLAMEIDRKDNIEVLIVAFYGDIDETVSKNIQTVSLDSSRRLDLESYRNLRSLIIDQDVDIVHTHPNATGSIARLVAVTTDAKVVDTRHNDHTHFALLRRLPDLPASAVTDCYISNSKHTLNSFSKLKNSIIRLTGGSHDVVYNGIDTAIESRIPDDPPISVDSPSVVSVAHYTKQKNHETLVDSVELVRESIPDAKLVLVGDGPRYEAIEEYIDNKGLSDAVIQTGFIQDRYDMLAVVKEADVFAISSWYEGFCVAAVEAMFLQTPVAVSDIDVLHEVVGPTGLFSDPSSPESFAENIVQLLEDKSTRDSLGEAASKRVREKFSLEQTAEGYIRAYRELIDAN